MQIKLKDNWEATGAKLNHRPYILPPNKQEIIDKTFNKMYNQDRLE